MAKRPEKDARSRAAKTRKSLQAARASWAPFASEQTDAELCGAVFRAFAARANELDVQALEPHERVATLVWWAHGVVGNGGLEYLLGGHLRGDPAFVHTAAAFEAIGATKAHRCITEALACFPRSTPQDDLEVRRAHYDAVPQAKRDRLDRAFWDAREEIEAKLAAWIRAHRPQLEAALKR